MAEKVNYSSTSSFYYIEFIVDGSVNKELMSNFRKVRIENSIINAYPIVNLEFHCDNQVFIDNDIYPHKVITMNLYYCNEDNERILEPLTFDLVIMEMNMELPPKSMNNISNETDFQRRNMMLTCVVKQCFELMNKTVNKMWQEPISVQNIVKELCDSIGISSEHFEPTNANTTIVDQCLIPPMTFRAAIDYLDDTYGIYEGRMFRYVNYNGTLEMWDLKTKFDSMKSNAVYKVHKMPSAPSSQPTGDIFKRAATLAEDYADHYLTYDSVSTLSRSNDAFVKNGYQIVNVFHPSADIVDYQNIHMQEIAKKYGINSDHFNMKVNENILNKRLRVHYDAIGNMPYYYTDTPEDGYKYTITSKFARDTMTLSVIQFRIYRKIKFHLLMRIGMPMFLQPYAEHELYPGCNYSGAYLITKSICTVSREGVNGQIGDEMVATAVVEAARTSQSQDDSK